MIQKLRGSISPKDFHDQIEILVKTKKLTYMEAVLHYCSMNGVEVEMVAAIIKNSPKIRAKIRVEAEGLNLLQKHSRLHLV
jgi:hypothetical protein